MRDTVQRVSETSEGDGWAETARPWFLLSNEEVTDALDVDPSHGLSHAEAERRLAAGGPNELEERGKVQPWQILLQQFLEPLVVVLIAAAILAAVLWALGGEHDEPAPYDTIVVLAIVLMNAALGFIQEYRAEQAVEALRKMSSPESTVRRDGELLTVPARELVPGDVLLLEAGVRIPADGRVLHTANLNVEEAALTGESVPVRKQTAALDSPEIALGDRTNMVFMGTAVTYGRGEAVVTATGMDTQMGSIATLIQSVDEEETPLQKELTRVGKQLGLLVLVIAAIVIATGVIWEGTFSGSILVDLFLFGVALAVAAIPEGLPAVVTAVLALGVRRMADRNAIVRRLPAVETLGSATVICSDKTGTLTRNEMTVRRVLLGVEQVVDVEGEGYEPAGGFLTSAGDRFDAPDQHLRSLLRGAVLNNDARLVHGEDGHWTIEGDPTEGALLVAARKAGLEPRDLRNQLARRGEIPFSSERKRMATIHQMDSHRVAFEKGAPDVVIDLCSHVRIGDQVVPLTPARREHILSINETFAARALRTLGFASRRLPETMADR